MLKRASLLAVLVTLAFTLALPSRAQDEITSPSAWIPADFAGFARLRMDSLSETFTGLNMGAIALTILQPTRPNYQPIQSMDMLFPLDHLDVPGVTFDQYILPWLGDELIVAYKDFDSGLAAAPDDLLYIFPADDALQAARSFAPVIQGQDLLQRETYRDTLLYLGDKTAFAITPAAVIIGQADMVRATLDVMAGEGERLIDRPGYQAVAGAAPPNALASAYLDGRLALATLSFIINGDDSAVPLLAALGQALRQQRGDAIIEQVLLGDALDSIGLSLRPDTLRLGTVRATLTLYDADRPAPVEPPPFNTALLDLIPQNAMIIQSGTDAAGAVYNVLYALPLTNFTGQILGAFPVMGTAGGASGAVARPIADDLRRAVSGLTHTLEQVARFNLQTDLLDHLGSSYAVVLLPRPNNPLPFFNTPYDVLIMAEVEDGQAALDGLTLLMRVILGLGELDTMPVEDATFNVLRPPGGDPLVSMGVLDDMLIIASGDALRLALDARRGDNRLISRPRWESISRDHMPQFYVDIPAFYSTFLPLPGGAPVRQIDQLGAWTTYLGDGLYQVHVIVTLPGEIG